MGRGSATCADSCCISRRRFKLIHERNVVADAQFVPTTTAEEVSRVLLGAPPQDVSYASLVPDVLHRARCHLVGVTNVMKVRGVLSGDAKSVTLHEEEEFNL